LGWEVKSNLNDSTKVMKGKGQIIKYARIYLTADRPLTSIFYGCLTDGKLWQFIRVQLVDDNGAIKMKFEESCNYEWNAHTASLIAGLIDHYYNEILIKASESSR
jgi:hypothetical protein